MSSIRPAETRSSEATSRSTATGTTTASTSCGSVRPNSASRASTPATAAVATSALSAPSSAVGLFFNRAETRSSRNCDNTPDAARVPIASNPQVVAARETVTAASNTSGVVDARERGAVERARDDTGKQDGLREDEQGSHDPEQGVGSERDAGGARAAEEARVERSHVSESTAGGLRGSGRPRRALALPPGGRFGLPRARRGRAGRARVSELTYCHRRTR